MLTYTDNKIVLIGLSGAGKSTLAHKLAMQRPSYPLIHTDAYLQYGDYGSRNALTMLLHDVLPLEQFILEGSLCYRLLKIGLESEVFYPDVLINVVATSQTRSQRRPDKDYSQMDVMYRSMWKQYQALDNVKPPRYIEYNSELIEQI